MANEELSLVYNGNPIEYDDPNVTRTMYGAPEIEPITYEWREETFPGYGVAIAGEPVPLPRGVSFTVESRIKEATFPLAYRYAVNESNALSDIFSPKHGEVRLRFDRLDVDDDPISRYLRVLSDYAPPWAWKPQGGEGEFGVRGSARIRTRVSAVARFPWFVDTVPCFDATVTPSQPVIITNPGDRWVGFQMEVGASTYNGNTMTLTTTYTLDGVDVVGILSIIFPDGTPAQGTVLEYWDPAADLGHPIGARSFFFDVGTQSWRRAVAVPQSNGWLSFPPGVPVTLSMGLSGGSSGTTSINLRVTPIYEGF
ncbi:MAG: hypothetical protein IPH08_04185 [Rhodocyclaceae bacterium]|nr:hypothetical protein [Rhodocyclaceae bacterium]MBK6906332.1 hypothetical protein [Rhodocyclaceae bacterium]